MMQLIHYEWKKLVHHKLSYVLLAFLLILPFLQTALGYVTLQFQGNPYNFKDQYSEVLKMENSSYEGLDALRYIDQNLHSFQGTINQSWEDHVTESRERFDAMVDKQKEIDEGMMIQMYGEDWKQLYEKSLQGTLLVGEVHDAQKKAGTFSTDMEDSQEKRREKTELYLAYSELSESMKNSSTLLYPNLFVDSYLKPENYLITQEKLDWMKAYEENERAYMRGQLPEEEKMEFQEEMAFSYGDVGNNQSVQSYMNQRFLQRSSKFDSTVAVQWFVNTMNLQTFFAPLSFLILGLLLLPVFTQETSTRSDQIMRAVNISSQKQCIAKGALILMVVLVVMLFHLLCYLAIPQLLIGFHDLNTIFQATDFISTTMTLPLYSCKEILLTCSFGYLCSGVLMAGCMTAISAFSKKSYHAILCYLLLLLILCAGPILYQLFTGMAFPWNSWMPSMMARPDTQYTLLLTKPYDVVTNTIYNGNYLILKDHVIFSFWVILPVMIFLYLGMTGFGSLYQTRREIKNK